MCVTETLGIPLVRIHINEGRMLVRKGASFNKALLSVARSPTPRSRPPLRSARRRNPAWLRADDGSSTQERFATIYSPHGKRIRTLSSCASALQHRKSKMLWLPTQSRASPRQDNGPVLLRVVRAVAQFVRSSLAPMTWDRVYRLVKKIPRGRVVTYGALAKKLALPGGARVAGYAMASCPSGQGIPWHRVVGAGGRLLISEPHASLQRRLLETEGVEIEGRRIDMDRYAWPISQRKIRSTANTKKAQTRR
jgi:methylated-DNA-protein-cysteine methyltransferase related protein